MAAGTLYPTSCLHTGSALRIRLYRVGHNHVLKGEKTKPMRTNQMFLIFKVCIEVCSSAIYFIISYCFGEHVQEYGVLKVENTRLFYLRFDEDFHLALLRNVCGICKHHVCFFHNNFGHGRNSKVLPLSRTYIYYNSMYVAGIISNVFLSLHALR